MRFAPDHRRPAPQTPPPPASSFDSHNALNVRPQPGLLAGENTEQKLAYFWSASDALAKYLTIGYPEVGALLC